MINWVLHVQNAILDGIAQIHISNISCMKENTGGLYITKSEFMIKYNSLQPIYMVNLQRQHRQNFKMCTCLLSSVMILSQSWPSAPSGNFLCYNQCKCFPDSTRDIIFWNYCRIFTFSQKWNITKKSASQFTKHNSFHKNIKYKRKKNCSL